MKKIAQELTINLANFSFSMTSETDAPVKEPPVKPSETPTTPSKAPTTPAPAPDTKPGEAPLPCPGPCRF